MKIFKKIISLSLLCIMTFAVFAFVGCNKNPHTHAYGEKHYTISSDKSNAYISQDCVCGKTKKVKIENAIIVNPDNAQEEIDKNINGKVIVFDAGTYGDLIFRPSLETLESVYEYDAVNKTTIGDNISDITTLSQTKNYLYNRTLENITLVGTSGSTFKGIVAVESAHIGRDTFTRIERTGFTPKEAGVNKRFDYIRNIYIENSSYDDKVIGYVANVSLNGFSVQNINFSGKNGRVYIYGNGEGFSSNFKNITVNNCNFTTEEPFYGKITGLEDRGISAVYISMNANATQSTKLIENVQITNNKSTGHFQGYHVFNTKNTTITHNETKNTPHNGISVQSGYGATTSGYTIISDNLIEATGVGVTTGERAIRFNAVKGTEQENATILIKNNTFKNCVEDRTAKREGVQLLATETLTYVTCEFTNNTYNGEKLDNIYPTNLSKLIIYLVEPVIA